MGGTDSSLKKHLSNEEIDQISQLNPTLIPLFNQYKNAKGNVVLKDLEAILGGIIEPKFTNKLYELCSSGRNKFNLTDFKYLYSIFLTNNYEAKLNFITDIIFTGQTSITLDKYKKRLEDYFQSHKELNSRLFNNEFISQMTTTNKIYSDNFIKNLDHSHKNYIESFKFVERFELDTHKLVLNKALCECDMKFIRGESYTFNAIVTFNLYRNMIKSRTSLD
jgi:hypothetical protein